jgi:hypothetical protein
VTLFQQEILYKRAGYGYPCHSGPDRRSLPWRTQVAKKKKPAIVRRARKIPFDADRLTKIARRLRTQSNEFVAHANRLKKAGLTEINIDGNKMLTRALKQVDRFLRNSQRDLDELISED